MAYAAPSSFDLKQRYPSFQGVDDTLVGLVLAEVAPSFDDTWTDDDRRQAVLLNVAHLLTLEGHGKEGRFPGMKRVKDGSIELERANNDGSGLMATSYGRRLCEMYGYRSGGPIVV